MGINDAISQLKNLREIEPNENWVVSAREEILTKAPINDINREYTIENPSFVDNITYLYESLSKRSKLIPSLASISIIVLVGSFITVTAAKTSLPGDLLYAIKIANEDVVLAVANEDDKPSLEMEYAGKRLEELVEISKKASDSNQKEKAEQLVMNFEEKVASASEKMTKISQGSEKKKLAKTAKQITNQTSKYSEVLAKTKESLPSVVKDKINDKIASAMTATEKANMDALLILAEANLEIDEKEISDEELTGILIKKVEEIRTETAVINNEKSVEENTAESAEKIGSSNSTNEQKQESNEIVDKDEKTILIESINENISNNNLVEAVKGIAEVKKINSRVDVVPIDEAMKTEEGVNIESVSESGNVEGVNTENSDANYEEDNSGKVNNIINPVPAE